MNEDEAYERANEQRDLMYRIADALDRIAGSLARTERFFLSPPAPHPFQGFRTGTPDRDCTLCGRTDRDPIHSQTT
jgi:hypothetical protein